VAEQTILGSLYVTTPGAYLGIDHDALRIDIEGEAARMVPLMGVDGVIVTRPRAVSARVIERLAETGRPLTILDGRGVFMARVVGPVTGSVHLRMAQYRAADSSVGLAIAQNVVLAKVQNSRSLLMRRSRDASLEARSALVTAADELRAIVSVVSTANTLDALRGHEGDAARRYFGSFHHLVSRPGRAFALERRERRPPRGRTNALLSYLYTLLTHDAVAAAETVGLDPQVGYLHALRPGRPGLALDLVEELRAPLADRLALSLVNRRELSEDDFDVQPGGAVWLAPTGRRIVNRAWAERRQQPVRHGLLREDVPWGLVLHVQARLLARHLRGEVASYPAFLAPE
jgi:CRISPR-associated protein Cas1